MKNDSIFPIVFTITAAIWLGMVGLLGYSIIIKDGFLFKLCAVYWLLHIGTFFLVWSWDFRKVSPVEKEQEKNNFPLDIDSEVPYLISDKREAVTNGV